MGRSGVAVAGYSGLLSRRPDDRRFVTIELTEPVKEWLGQELPALRLRPLTAAIGRATEQKRTAILDGLATLERLLTSDSPQPDPR